MREPCDTLDRLRIDRDRHRDFGSIRNVTDTEQVIRGLCRRF